MSIITEMKNILSFPELTFCEEIDLLLEIKKQRLMNNTDTGRKYRAINQVRTRPMNAILVDAEKKIWLLEYNFKSFPSTENKRHWGYILYDEPNSDITQVYCDCADFFYRLYAPFVKKKLASFNLDMHYNLSQKVAYADRSKMKNTNLTAKYKGRALQPNKDGVLLPHNRQWTIETNPSGNLYCCKHLYAALKGYVEDDNTQAKSIPLTPVKVEISVGGRPPREETVYIPTDDLKKWGSGEYAERMKKNFVIKHFNELGHGRVKIVKWL